MHENQSNNYLFSLEMSSSWNFPARASPSYEGSEPSRAGALQFPSWNRAEIFLSPIKNYNQISPFSYSIMIITNSNQLHYHLYEFMEDKMCFRKLKSMILLHKLRKKIKINQLVFGQFSISSWMKKAISLAKNPYKHFWYIWRDQNFFQN